MAVIFPKIVKLRLHGFDKIFTSNEFEISFSNNLSILLGGNGLGKTTLLQCIVYGLTGGTNNIEVEETKLHRWDHTYFKGRINADAYIWIDFLLGEKYLKVKRGFNSPRVLECAMITKNNSEDIIFDQAIIEYGNYNSVNDFSFIINRLLYLPENRRSLLWDYNAQIRALMIINNEFVVEQEYRSLRQLIKLKDSNKRKIGWDIGRIEKSAALQNVKETSNDSKNNSDASAYIENKKDLLTKLKKLTDTSKQLYTKIKSDQEARNKLVQNILIIGDQIRSTESDYLREHLLEHDEKNALVFNKTLKTGYCPSCDQKSDNLKNIIQERIKRGDCLVCGEPISKHQATAANFNSDDLNSQLNEKITARNTLDIQISQSNTKLTQIEEKISTFRNELSELDFGYSDGYTIDENDENESMDFVDEELIAKEYINLCQQEKEFELEIAQMTKQADKMYDIFITNFQTRYEQLHSIYSDLAYKFLGIPVELKFIKSKASFVNMNYLVPHFSNVDRDSSETCSEAQRFFLDIAFRMSLIALNKAISNIDSTFICETPENALDISYIDNVVKMFMTFMQKGGTMVLTNNLQYLGIAQTLIKEAKKQKIKIDIFDLLTYGKLSEIQSASKQLLEIRDAIIKEVE
ncbi:ATP-binding protein [Desulfosporosinus youngiae]|uniref:Rad50/SbcC-type AAA domain-containing protein n=1 Tax=Desulfosporosinus youngiae DSM 17734 TaxID=768710 RepID=H5XUH8_9FIRM|nr:ATP-binding protein [Desulfosporosinus youngiae]EHQ88996.1 hypothetical protein DesyoDRAFT_1876 [Desulfosporosinus youngiae DSM 17734]